MRAEKAAAGGAPQEARDERRWPHGRHERHRHGLLTAARRAAATTTGAADP